MVEDRHIQVADRAAQHPAHEQRRRKNAADPPLEYEVTVAASFNTHKAAIAVTGRLPSSACVSVL